MAHKVDSNEKLGRKSLEQYQEQSLADALASMKLAHRRYWSAAIWPAFAVGLLVVAFAFLYPKWYSSDSLIDVQSQALTTKLLDAPSLDETKGRIDNFIQRVLSRPRLKKILDHYNLYPRLKSKSGADRVLKRFQENIDVMQAKSRTGRDMAHTFRLTFTYEDPKKTWEVTKALTNLFIDESRNESNLRIQGTVEFLDAQLRDTQKQLTVKENRLQQFVRDNAGKLPENREQLIALLGQYKTQIATNLELAEASAARRRHLAGELDELKKRPAFSPTGSLDEMQGLSQLESALSVLLTRYSEQHPDVIRTRQRISALKRLRKNSSKSSARSRMKTSAGDSHVMRQLKRDVNELDIKIASLNSENKRFKESISKLEQDLTILPVKEQELLEIRRDYKTIKERYDKLFVAREEANLQRDMLRSNKSAHFKVIEPPEMPLEAEGPFRSVIFSAGGVGVGLIYFSVLCGLFFCNLSLKSVSEVERVTGLPVLGVVPPMESKQLKSVRFKRSIISLLSSIVIVSVGFVVMRVLL